ncbi:MAG: HAD family hydrolase [Solobacterium sp.]|nr:HAD family hydrolase [Solobacterium sp.]
MNLVFFDIDGTLATGKHVPESAAEGLRLLRKNGNLVFICTGRNPAYAEKNFGQYADGFICCNGRLAVKGGEVLYSHPLSDEQIREIVKRMDAVGAGYAFLGTDEGYYGGDPAGYEVMSRVQDKGFVKNGLAEHMNVYTFDAYLGTPDRISVIQEALDGFAIANPHGPHPSADITVLGVDKGTALVHVAEVLGVPLENTYGFGDGRNDICMLKAVGHGIAMGNAIDETKAAADYVTTDINDNGVWNGLKHYGLI